MEDVLEVRAEVIELGIFEFVAGIHKAVSFVHHMLLASSGVLEHLAAKETQIREMDLLSNM